MKLLGSGRGAIAHRLAIAAVPVAAVAALIGPAAGTAHAMQGSPVSCAATYDAADSDDILSGVYQSEASFDFLHGNVSGYISNSLKSNSYRNESDYLFNIYYQAGC
jgi:hypothetical protein